MQEIGLNENNKVNPVENYNILNSIKSSSLQINKILDEQNNTLIEINEKNNENEIIMETNFKFINKLLNYYY